MDWKRVEDMTDEELLALKEEDVERMVKLLMAEEGIPLYQKPEMPVYDEVEPPDGEFFTFRLFDGVAFPTAEGIRQVVKLMQELGCERYIKDYSDPIGRHEPNILKAKYGDGDEFEISSENLYGVEAYNRSKEILKENKCKKKEYEAEFEKSKGSRNAAQKFRDEIWKPIYEARKRERQCEQADVRFSEYLNLADNNVDIAWKFYDKAHMPEEHVKCYFRDKYDIPIIDIIPE